MSSYTSVPVLSTPPVNPEPDQIYVDKYSRIVRRWTGAAWEAESGVLARTQYAPAGLVSKNVTTNTLAVLDTVNLTIPFTAPQSGAVIIEMSGRVSSSTTNDSAVWGLLNHSDGSVVAGSVLTPVNDWGGIIQCVAKQVITGLTPGQAYQWDWAAANGVAGVTTSLKCQGIATVLTAVGNNIGGPAIMEVRTA